MSNREPGINDPDGWIAWWLAHHHSKFFAGHLARLASPFSPANGATLDAEPDDLDRQILRLMSVGLKDEAIARNLGIGVRTLRRRIQRVMRDLGAGTRFQAGARATARGWIP